MPISPENITDRPDSPDDSGLDALTDVFSTVHLKGSLYYRSELSAPWGMTVPASQAAQFHVIRRGRCSLALPDTKSPPLFLESGDVVLLSRGPKHVLSDAPGTDAPGILDILQRVKRTGSDCHAPLIYGGGGEQTALICGYFQFESGNVHPLLSALPEVVLIRGEGGRSAPGVETVLDLLAAEVERRRPGSETVMNRLTEVLLIQMLRAHPADRSPMEMNWLSGLKDPHIGTALGYIHRQPEREWTVDNLASAVGMSRSGFADRFKSLIGEPPMQYLTRWRMEIAAGHLRNSSLSLGQIAGKVGYRAEPAFSRVFKKMLGISPGAYRRQGPASV